MFLRDEMPWLVAVGKQCFEWAMAQSPAASLQVGRLVDEGEEEQGGEGGEVEMAEGGMCDGGVGFGGCEGEML